MIPEFGLLNALSQVPATHRLTARPPARGQAIVADDEALHIHAAPGTLDARLHFVGEAADVGDDPHWRGCLGRLGTADVRVNARQAGPAPREIANANGDDGRARRVRAGFVARLRLCAARL
jgi:hypothetical protein